MRVMLVAALWAAWTSTAAAAPPEVAFRPKQVLLGVDPKVEIEVRAQDASRLKSFASTGALSHPQAAGPDLVRFTWTPPEARYPHMAILMFWAEPATGPPELAVARIPLLGRTDLDVRTEPQADVKVEIGGRIFGPRRADARGLLKMPVEVPPGYTEARVLSEAGGSSTSVTTPLNVPPSNRLAAVIGPEPVPLAGGWAWVVAADRLDLPALKVDASGGTVKLQSSAADRALYRVVPSPDSRIVSVAFHTAGAPEDLATAAMDVDVPAVVRPKVITSVVLTPGLIFGATYGGGSNLSAMGEVELAASFPALGPGIAAGVALEGNTMGLSSPVAGLGEVSSWLVAFSPLALGRVQMVELGPAALHIDAGAGPVFFNHQVRATFQPSLSEGGVSLEVFAGVQLSYRVGPMDVLLDLRGAFAPVKTPHLSAN
ncbi:MAG TPA: hypothetical protein VND93_31920, partial [Myxococcales bacterium]|nr:hypothetical protein [Myxococcales bacterium]